MVDDEYVKALESTVQKLQAERRQLQAKVDELLFELEKGRSMPSAPPKSVH